MHCISFFFVECFIALQNNSNDDRGFSMIIENVSGFCD